MAFLDDLRPGSSLYLMSKAACGGRKIVKKAGVKVWMEELGWGLDVEGRSKELGE